MQPVEVLAGGRAGGQRLRAGVDVRVVVGLERQLEEHLVAGAAGGGDRAGKIVAIGRDGQRHLAGKRGDGGVAPLALDADPADDDGDREEAPLDLHRPGIGVERPRAVVADPRHRPVLAGFDEVGARRRGEDHRLRPARVGDDHLAAADLLEAARRAHLGQRRHAGVNGRRFGGGYGRRDAAGRLAVDGGDHRSGGKIGVLRPEEQVAADGEAEGERRGGGGGGRKPPPAPAGPVPGQRAPPPRPFPALPAPCAPGQACGAATGAASFPSWGYRDSDRAGKPRCSGSRSGDRGRT